MAFENLKSTGIKYVLTKMKSYFLQIKDAVKSVNGNEPDDTGDITVTTVPYAQNLESESSHRSYDVFLQRTTGGDSSVSNGDAWLMDIKGNNVHDGYVAEDIEMTVTALGEDAITATIDRDTFVSYVSTSGTTTLVYSTDWSADPTLYGITVTGTPVAGDTIVVEYTKEVRGTITVANPGSFVSTGWNLYDHSNGYAKVVKYSHGYRIDGTYTAIKFATSPTGTQSDVVVNSGNFDIPSDGYIIVTGGNSSSTAIYPVWEDWDEGYTGDFEAYNASIVDLSTIMSTYFPYGLLKAGSVVDELNLNLGQAISRVERMNYTSENLATAKSSGREYEYDENYIFLARASAVTTSVTVSGAINSNDHGIEYFTGSGAEVDTEILYGNNLKNKLERDVLTLSSQDLSSAQKNQVWNNLGLDFGNIKFGKGNINWTLAQFVADVATYDTGDIILYRVGSTVASAMLGGATSIAYECIVQKASSSNIYYSIMGRSGYACGNIAISNSTVTVYWSSDTLKVTNQSSTASDVSVATATDTNMLSVDLEVGEYLIIFTAIWAANGTGRRNIWASESQGGTRINYATDVTMPAVDGAQTRQQLVFVYRSTSAHKVYMCGYQNSGSTLSTSVRYSILRLR